MSTRVVWYEVSFNKRGSDDDYLAVYSKENGLLGDTFQRDELEEYLNQIIWKKTSKYADFDFYKENYYSVTLEDDLFRSFWTKETDIFAYLSGEETRVIKKSWPKALLNLTVKDYYNMDSEEFFAEMDIINEVFKQNCPDYSFSEKILEFSKKIEVDSLTSKAEEVEPDSKAVYYAELETTDLETPEYTESCSYVSEVFASSPDFSVPFSFYVLVNGKEQIYQEDFSFSDIPFEPENFEIAKEYFKNDDIYLLNEGETLPSDATEKYYAEMVSNRISIAYSGVPEIRNIVLLFDASYEKKANKSALGFRLENNFEDAYEKIKAISPQNPIYLGSSKIQSYLLLYPFQKEREPEIKTDLTFFLYRVYSNSNIIET